MVTLTLEHLFGNPRQVGRADPSGFGIKLPLSIFDLSKLVLLSGSISGWWVSASIRFDDGTQAIIVPQSSAGGTINLVNEDITDLLIGKLGFAEILFIAHTTTAGGVVTWRGGSITFQQNPVITKTRLEGEFSRLTTKDNDGIIHETKGQLTLINESIVDVFVRGSFGINQIIPKGTIETIEINSFVNEDAHFELSLIGDSVPYKTFDFPIAKRTIDLLPTARILDVSNYIVTSGEFASFVTQMLFEIDNTKSEKIATVDAIIDYFGKTTKGFQVPPKSKLRDGIERQILQKVTDLIQSTGSASILNRNRDFTGSLNVQVGLPPDLPPPQIIGPDQPEEPPGEPGPDEGLSLDTKIGLAVLGIGSVIGVVFGAVLAQKPKR